MKSTHNGTCQVCGALQALPRGVLAKHGYDVKFHYFHGVCPGAGHLPLEQERAFADTVAAGLMVTSRKAAADAIAVSRGELLPTRALSGQRIIVDGRWEAERVPFEQAPERYQREAVAALQRRHESEARETAWVSKNIVERADKITGKQALQPREAVARKVIVTGTRFKLHGVVRTALRVEERMARGCGPYMNGNYMPHVVFIADSGKEFAYPLRLIRQASILDAE